MTATLAAEFAYWQTTAFKLLMAFVAVLTGERGRVVLSEHGFDIP